LSFCQATEATILLLCEREYFIEALQDFPLIEMQIKSIAQNRRQKLEEKIACLKEKVETQGQEDEFHQKKLLNSTKYLNKVVAKSFMKKRREKLLKKSNTSQILPKMDLNTTTFSRRNFRESSLFSPQEPTTTLNKVISAPLKSFNNALETVNEEKVQVTTPGLGIHLFCDKEERSLTSISGSKPKGKALLTYKKEEKIGLSRQEACDQKILKSCIEETSRSQQEEEGKKNKGNDPISHRENDPLIKKSQKYELNNWLVPLGKNKSKNVFISFRPKTASKFFAIKSSNFQK